MEMTMLVATVVIMAIIVTIPLGDNDKTNNNVITETTSDRLITKTLQVEKMRCMVFTVNGKQKPQNYK
jgi:hypothetical protein